MLQNPPEFLRPELPEGLRAHFARERVLSLTGAAGGESFDPWDGAAAADAAAGAVPECVVDPFGRADFVTVQDAICAAVRLRQDEGSARRVVIGLAPGVHEGLAYVPRVEVGGQGLAFTLVALGVGAEICANIDAEMPGAEYAARFGPQFETACAPVRAMFEAVAAKDKITTHNSPVLWVAGDDFAAHGLRIVNSYNCDRPDPGAGGSAAEKNAAGQYRTGQHQAVAVMVAGADRAVLVDCDLESYQDTLYLRHPAPFTTARTYLRGCRIAGDVDFIFGQATGYFERCTIVSRMARARHHWVTAPATNIRTTYGVVFDCCRFTHDHKDAGFEGRISLGRQWFESVKATPYGASDVPGFTLELAEQSAFEPPIGTISRATLESVGKCVLIDCELGDHINPAAPWDEWCGGAYGRDGAYAAAPWHPRYRPFQAGVAAFLELLAPWADPAALGYGDLDPDEVWLAEAGTRPLGRAPE